MMSQLEIYSAAFLSLMVGSAIGQTDVQLLSDAQRPRVIVTTDLGADPDDDSLTYSWVFYREPSSYEGPVVIEGDSSITATMSIPSNANGTEIHIVLEVHDDGTPNLYAYRRVVFKVQ